MDAPYLVTVTTATAAARQHHVIANSPNAAVEKVRGRYEGRSIIISEVQALAKRTGSTRRRSDLGEEVGSDQWRRRDAW
jgi:predicted secreted protein